MFCCSFLFLPILAEMLAHTTNKRLSELYICGEIPHMDNVTLFRLNMELDSCIDNEMF